MTDISVQSTSYQYEKRGWLWGPHGTGPGETLSITLDVSTFTQGTHYPNGYIPSGTALAKITASGKYGPYDSGATDGRQTVSGTNPCLLFSSVRVVRDGGSVATQVGAAGLVSGFVEAARLPFGSGAGFASSTYKAALPLVYWT